MRSVRESLSQRPRRFSYASCLSASEKVDWKVEDLIGPDRRMDFDRPFLPESLARTAELEFLTAAEKRTLNQIRGHGYLYTFGMVEEFILPFVLDHARPGLADDDARTRALLAFAAEEAKHIDLFERFRSQFLEGFGSACEVIGPPEAIAEHVLSQDRLGVALLILHIEWMTQRHYLESVRGEDPAAGEDLDPQFASLLRHHWMEEAQHARLDTLMVEEMAADMDAEAIERGVETYLELGGFLDQGLLQQARYDLEALLRAEQLELSRAQRERLVEEQHQALRWTFIGSGMTHPELVETLERLSPAARERVAEIAPAFC